MSSKTILSVYLSKSFANFLDYTFNTYLIHHSTPFMMPSIFPSPKRPPSSQPAPQEITLRTLSHGIYIFKTFSNSNLTAQFPPPTHSYRFIASHPHQLLQTTVCVMCHHLSTKTCLFFDDKSLLTLFYNTTITIHNDF